RREQQHQGVYQQFHPWASRYLHGVRGRTVAAVERDSFSPKTMHYLTYVIIGKNTNIEEAVAQAMEPFSEHRTVAPWQRRISADEIAVMAKSYRVRRNALHKL